ncbi:MULTISPECIES: hypothetical protein [Bacillaceae]|uniref:hypothetical protein n=1 Tax=Bacillaceae TaxID=186817 RepID=UPI0010534955|nr:MULTISPECIES: hypothetical protein [Bacillaceae]MDT2047330.1 hypothetical protein [Priestia flexa]TDB55080.1 hypothetical protein EPL02_02455 [Bacillus sp. CBEL-1]
MRIVKPSKILITSVSKKQITNVLLYDCCIGTLGYFIGKYDQQLIYELTGILGSILLPKAMKSLLLRSEYFFFWKERVIVVQ